MSASSLLLIVVAFGFLYFMLMRPQRRRQLESQRMLSSLAVGDEVLTAGGIYGRVAELEDEAVLVEVAPGVRVKVARRAIGAVIPPDEASVEPPTIWDEEPPAGD